MKVQIINLSNNKLPQYETSGASGMDVRADFSRVSSDNLLKVYGPAYWNGSYKSLRLAPGSRALIPTGLKVAIPQGYEIQIRPRSGLALKEGVSMVNCIATIDSDYRGEMGVIVINHGLEDIVIENGERIAQLILAKVETCEWEEVESLDETNRGDGGFGHTNKN